MFATVLPYQNFYPRPPRGGRPAGIPIYYHGQRFLSTPSARRATSCTSPERRQPHISIHALREEGDALADEQIAAINEFLSTPSARRATHGARPDHRRRPISIHALREEGDPWPRGIKSLTV